jgi:hypothetical protein
VTVSTVNNPSEVLYFTCALGFKIDEILAFKIVSKCRVKGGGNSDYWVLTVTAVRCKWGESEATQMCLDTGDEVAATGILLKFFLSICNL